MSGEGGMLCTAGERRQVFALLRFAYFFRKRKPQVLLRPCQEEFESSSENLDASIATNPSISY
jgi:hypothetical protein